MVVHRILHEKVLNLGAENVGSDIRERVNVNGIPAAHAYLKTAEEQEANEAHASRPRRWEGDGHVYNHNADRLDPKRIMVVPRFLPERIPSCDTGNDAATAPLAFVPPGRPPAR